MHHNLTITTPSSELGQPELYINRELSWIEFNRRVLEEAEDSRHPLLERVKFLSIFDTNLDEFIMIRLAGLKDQIAAHVTTLSPDGLTAEEQLAAVRQHLAPLVQEVRECWRDELLPMLEAQRIYVLDYEQLDEQQQAAMHTYFENEVFPVLTPLAVDAGHQFPHISNRSLNLAVVITDPVHGKRFARAWFPYL
jgi:polyphosphate kinase